MNNIKRYQGRGKSEILQKVGELKLAFEKYHEVYDHYLECYEENDQELEEVCEKYNQMITGYIELLESVKLKLFKCNVAIDTPIPTAVPTTFEKLIVSACLELGSTCNHVAAVLFKMNYFWRQGINNKPVLTDHVNGTSGIQKKIQNQLSFKQVNARNKVVTIKPLSFKELSKEFMDICPEAVVFQGRKVHSSNDVFTEEVSDNFSRSAFM
ncbi:hypothetical protein GQR58_015407 [Nymphon striatum]|nr:hypothetical protein GQR58_015407 [Nymphon striatum]